MFAAARRGKLVHHLPLPLSPLLYEFVSHYFTQRLCAQGSARAGRAMRVVGGAGVDRQKTTSSARVAAADAADADAPSQIVRQQDHLLLKKNGLQSQALPSHQQTTAPTLLARLRQQNSGASTADPAESARSSINRSHSHVSEQVKRVCRSGSNAEGRRRRGAAWLAMSSEAGEGARTIDAARVVLLQHKAL